MKGCAFMSKVVWYRFEFEDGNVQICRGMSRLELKVEIRKHGKLISKTIA